MFFNVAFFKIHYCIGAYVCNSEHCWYVAVISLQYFLSIRVFSNFDVLENTVKQSIQSTFVNLCTENSKARSYMQRFIWNTVVSKVPLITQLVKLLRVISFYCTLPSLYYNPPLATAGSKNLSGTRAFPEKKSHCGNVCTPVFRSRCKPR